MAAHSLGIDIGGTFTDLVLFDHDSGEHFTRKVLTTHANPATGVLDGTTQLLDLCHVDAASVARVVHATTLFTNALIERKGAKTGLITTAGFADTLEIGRERKYELYDLQIDNPPPLIPRDLRLEVRERVKATGEVRVPLDLESVEDAVAVLAAQNVESVAIVFLHSYANPTHEIEAADLISRRFPQLFVTSSHEVVREIREFERTSTAAANAYVKPLAHRYLDDMQSKLRERGTTATLLLMISNGGLTHIAEAKRNPVQMLESGPAAGALAAAFFGAEEEALLAFDMGGTTAKLSLIDSGEPLIAYGFEAARQKRFVEGSGLPIRISTVELIEIGAGGGSIAQVDEIGLLKVGPHSAGSQPGPACYGLGGVEPTVTDADLVLGYLNPEYFAGGTFNVSIDKARQAIARLAERVGLPLQDVAWGIHDIVNENMASAARVHIAERGRDPRNYAVLATGGAGPVHVYYVARKIGVKKIICPPSAGVASALGLLVAPAKVDRVTTLGMRLDTADCRKLEEAFARLEREAKAVLVETKVPLEKITVQRYADGRFVGQGFDLVVPLPPGPYDTRSVELVRVELKNAFERASREKFSRTPPNVPIEFINIRVTVRVPVSGAPMRVSRDPRIDAPALTGRRQAYFPESNGYVDTPVYNRLALKHEQMFEGPAVIEEEGSTLVVGPGSTVVVAGNSNLVVTVL